MTVFPSPNQQFPDKKEWWSSIVQEHPESISERPRDDQLTMTGNVSQDTQLVLSVQPDRIDWVLQHVPLEAPPEDRVSIGNYSEIYPEFLSMMDSWIKCCGVGYLRLGWAGVLIFPVDDLSTGYKALNRLLPSVQLDSESSSNFSYSINRPRESERCKRKINRLSTWSVSLSRVFKIQINGASERQITSAPIDNDIYSCRLEYDINNVQSNEPVPMDCQLLNELAKFADEIIENGDIP